MTNDIQGAGDLKKATSSSEILTVLKSLASRAVTALGLEAVGYKALRNVEVRLHCDGSEAAHVAHSASSSPSCDRGKEEGVEMGEDVDLSIASSQKLSAPLQCTSRPVSDNPPGSEVPDVQEVQVQDLQSCLAQN